MRCGRLPRIRWQASRAHTAEHFAQGRMPDARARTDIEQGMTRIEAELGYRPRHFSYPYGDPSSAGDADFAARAEALGFRSATTTRKGLVQARTRRTVMPPAAPLAQQGISGPAHAGSVAEAGSPSHAAPGRIRSLGID